MSTGDYIAVGAILIAFLSAYYARQARDAARKANVIAVRENRRPLRLAVFLSALQFCRYCAEYVTLQHLGSATGTRDLVARIDAFKWEVEQHGHLDMADVERRITELINAAWCLQRLLDRISGGQNVPLDKAYATAEAQREAVSDWFAAQANELRSLFRPYLADA